VGYATFINVSMALIKVIPVDAINLTNGLRWIKSDLTLAIESLKTKQELYLNPNFWHGLGKKLYYKAEGGLQLYFVA